MKEQSTIPRLWKAEDVAQRVGIAQSTVYEWVRQNYIPHILLGTGKAKPCIRFSPTDIDNWLKAMTIEGRTTRLPKISIKNN